jgi:dihydroxycyclohexadiene carboxylate dehydrogenase
MRFSDKVVAITGAAQGIGRQTAEQAAAEGFQVSLQRQHLTAGLSQRRRQLMHPGRTIDEQQSRAFRSLEADLEQWPSAEQAFADGVAHFGRIDVLINNVGPAPDCRTEPASPPAHAPRANDR